MLKIWQIIKHTKIIPILLTVLVLGTLFLFFLLGGFVCLTSDDFFTQIIGLWGIIFSIAVLSVTYNLITEIIKKSYNEVNNTNILILVSVIVFSYFTITCSPKNSYLRKVPEKVSEYAFKITDSFTGGILNRLDTIIKKLDNEICVSQRQESEDGRGNNDTRQEGSEIQGI